VMEQLVHRFLKREYFIDLMNIYQETNNDERATLNTWRFGFDRDFLARESEYAEFAEIAINIGSPAEAQTVLEKGMEKGAVKAGDRINRLLGQARLRAAEDKKTIAALDKEARAGKNGEADVGVGLAYYGLGQYDKAVEAIQRGLTAERVGRVKRVDDANMVLGISQLKLGNKDEAVKAFTAAGTDPRMTRAAAFWLL